MRSFRHLAAASLLLTAAAALAQDKPSWDIEAVAPYEEEFVTDEVDSGDGQPWPWPDFMQVSPLPGQYRSKMILVSFESPMLEELGGDFMQAMMREAFPEVREFCVTGGEEHDDWGSQFTDGECGAPEITIEGDRFTATSQCSNPAGEHTSVRIEGEVGESRSRMDMHVQVEEPEFGTMTMHMRSTTRRTGDCS